MTMRITFAWILTLVLGSAPAAAASFEAAEERMDTRLEKALNELSTVRKDVTRRKVPLSKAVSDLEDEVQTLVQKRAGFLKVRDGRTLDLTSLRKQVSSLREQEEFVDSRLDEFVRDFESRLDISELGRYEETTSRAKLANKDVSMNGGERRAAKIAVVQSALDRVDGQVGGEVYPGAALSPDGLLTEGHFIAMGPAVYFASGDGSLSGLVENRLNAADPVVVPLPTSSNLLAVAQAGTGQLPLDATLGKALKVEKARKGLFEYVNEGGVVGYVIVTLGIVALLLGAFKAVEILGFPVATPAQMDEVLEELSRDRMEGATDRARRIEGVAGDMIATGVEHARESRGLIEELLFEKILKARPGLERFLPFLAITAAAAPLLGLLGTVTGMIKTFQLITIFGTGDAKSLSSGISEALVTTAMGLIVAIPTLVIHGALSRLAKRKVGLLEEISIGFVNGLASLGFASSSSPTERTDG